MKRTFWIGLFSLMLFNSLAIGGEAEATEKKFTDRNSLSARLLRQARELNQKITRFGGSYDAKQAANRFKNSAGRLYNCESGRFDRYNNSNSGYCDQEFFQTKNSFQRLKRSFRRGHIPYEIEEGLQTAQRILRYLSEDYNGGGRGPNPREEHICTAEPEEGWNTRPVRGDGFYSLSEAKLSALRTCERVYYPSRCFIKLCRRI